MKKGTGNENYFSVPYEFYKVNFNGAEQHRKEILILSYYIDTASATLKCAE